VPELPSPVSPAPLPDLPLDEVVVTLARASVAEPLARAAAALRAVKVTDDEILSAVAAAAAPNGSASEAIRLRDRAVAHDPEIEDAGVERLLLVRAAAASLPRVRTLPIGDAGRRMLLADFEFFGAPESRTVPLFRAKEPTFRQMAGVASLVRFPAGQLHWEVSGVARRMLLRAALPDWPRLAWWLLVRLGGRAPVAFTHVNGYRKNRFVMLEEESIRSYCCIAEALREQPHLRGLASASWFHAPDVALTSPHLAWTNRVILENGGVVISIGDASDVRDAIANSRQRRDALERGAYHIQVGLVLWPRRAMLGWADRVCR